MRKIMCESLKEALKTLKDKGFPRRSRNAYKLTKQALLQGEETKQTQQGVEKWKKMRRDPQRRAV